MNRLEHWLLVRKFKKAAQKEWFPCTIRLVKSLTHFHFRDYFAEVKSWKDDQVIPLTWRLYWKFKEHCRLERVAYEYGTFYDYIEGIEKGDIEWASFLDSQRNDVPDESKLPHFIPCQSAINAYRGKWKFIIKIDFYEALKERSFVNNYELTNLQNQLFDWCLKNVRDFFYVSDHAFHMEVYFTDPKDAMTFRLWWGDYPQEVQEIRNH